MVNKGDFADVGGAGPYNLKGTICYGCVFQRNVLMKAMSVRASFLSRARLFCALASAVAIGMTIFLEPPPVTYHMPEDGQLSLGLYDKDGELIRWLVQDEFRRAGDHREVWNGFDQWERKVVPGTYTVKGICHAPLKLDYLLTVDNPGQPPWPTVDGHGDWLSDEGNPQAAATDGAWIFLGAPDSEKGFTTIALDETGQRRWGTTKPRHIYSRSVAMALDGNFLYTLYAGPERLNPDTSPYQGIGAVGRAVLVCLDKSTGKAARFTREHGSLQVATWPYRESAVWLWNLRNHHSFTPSVYAGQPRYASLDVGEATDAVGLAAVGDRLYVSLREENRLLELNATTGQATGRIIPLQMPAGLCRLDDRTLLAISGTSVVKVRLDDGIVTPLITSGLSAPSSITIDQQGNNYISDWGASFQVKVFDAEGGLLRAIGKEGGRPWVGAWDPNGMLVPRGMAVTDKGELWVTEDDGSPPRVSVWNTATGSFIHDFIGPAPYGGGTYFWIDPHDRSQVHTQGTCFKVDYEKKTWTPTYIDYRRQDANDPFTPNGHDLGPHPQVRILYHDGLEYAVMNTAAGELSILRRQGAIYRPVAALGQVRDGQLGKLKSNGTGKVVWDSDVGYHLYEGYFPDCFRGHGGDSYCWYDANGDNLVQPDEMHWLPGTSSTFALRAEKLGRWTSGWGIDISPAWSFFFVTRFSDRQEIFRLDIKGWTNTDAPIYDLSEARPIISESLDHGINSLHVTNDEKLIVSYDFEQGHIPNAIAAYSLEGRELWAVATPKQQAGESLHANGAIYDFNVPGLGDVVCSWLYHGSFRPHLFTSDGLYVGTFLDDTFLAKMLHHAGLPIRYYVGTALDDAPIGPTALWSESAKYFYQATDGRLYLINGGNQQEHLFQIRGLEPQTTMRFETKYELKK
jgi:hypothetical protein